MISTSSGLEPTPLHDLGNRHSQALGAKQVLSVPDVLSPACGPPGAAGSSETLAAPQNFCPPATQECAVAPLSGC
jgi:hypothetical protein